MSRGGGETEWSACVEAKPWFCGKKEQLIVFWMKWGDQIRKNNGVCDDNNNDPYRTNPTQRMACNACLDQEGLSWIQVRHLNFKGIENRLYLFPH